MLKIIAIVLLLPSILVAAPKKEYNAAEAVSMAIRHILVVGLPKFKISPYRNHRIPDSDIAELSAAIVEASDKYSMNPMLLVATASREGSFRKNVVGRRGERATFQISPRNVKWLQEIEPNCNLDNHRGAAYCSAALLDYCAKECKGVSGAIVLYVTGRTCQPDTEHTKWMQEDRLLLTEELSKMFPILHAQN